MPVKWLLACLMSEKWPSPSTCSKLANRLVWEYISSYGWAMKSKPPHGL